MIDMERYAAAVDRYTALAVALDAALGHMVAAQKAVDELDSMKNHARVELHSAIENHVEESRRAARQTP